MVQATFKEKAAEKSKARKFKKEKWVLQPPERNFQRMEQIVVQSPSGESDRAYRFDQRWSPL